jgi:ribulose-phosphate 3-epimerase
MPLVVELAFSILAADFAHLADEIASAERGGGTIVHVDVMDGHFVPNITFGPPVVQAIRPLTKLPLDCHLMIEDPDRYIADFAAAGADFIGVHVEVCRHLNRTLQLIADHGVGPAVVLNPATPLEMVAEVLPMVHHVLVMSVNPGFGGQKFLPRSVERIGHLRRMRQEMGLNFRIEVDGGISEHTVADVVAAGADMLVAGSAIFAPVDGNSPGERSERAERTVANAQRFLQAARAATAVRV